MRQHLDTIPIWDAFKENSECPLCAIRLKNEASYVDNFLGGSVMEPDTRIEVNKKGFCQRHLKQLYDARNRLGLALMADTYLKETIGRLEKNAEALNQAASEEGGKPLPARAAAKLTRKPAATQTPAEETEALSCGCILCERLDDTMMRYILTVLYMYKHESDFKQAFTQSKGFCLPHYAQLARLAPEELSGKDLEEFMKTLTETELSNLKRMEQEIEWFTLKFDYKNRDKPWGNSSDSVERMINKLRGQ